MISGGPSRKRQRKKKTGFFSAMLGGRRTQQPYEVSRRAGELGPMASTTGRGIKDVWQVLSRSSH